VKNFSVPLACGMIPYDVVHMKSLFLALVLSFGLASMPVLAGPVDVKPAELPTEDVADIRNIILRQLNAFRDDDAEKAFSYAAPEIRRIFKTPEMFLHMVRKSYQSVYRPQSFAFKTIKRIDGNIVQPLAVVGPSGVSEMALYIMEQQPDGSWKIGACIMAREPVKNT
jgi:hypothetical protein